MSAQNKQVRKLPVSLAMDIALTYLHTVKGQHKARARIRKESNRDGWTYRPPFIKESTIAALHRRGLISACCNQLHGADLIRITLAGEARLSDASR